MLDFRYCVNSSSLDFVATASNSEPEDGNNGESNYEEEVIACPAVLGGCSQDGVCSLRSRQAVKSRLLEISSNRDSSAPMPTTAGAPVT